MPPELFVMVRTHYKQLKSMNVYRKLHFTGICKVSIVFWREILKQIYTFLEQKSFWNVQEVILEFFWSSFGVFFFWSSSGVLLEFFWRSSGVLLGFFWSSSGVLLELIWSSSGVLVFLEVSEVVLEISGVWTSGFSGSFWSFSGGFLECFWSSSGVLLEFFWFFRIKAVFAIRLV